MKTKTLLLSAHQSKMGPSQVPLKTITLSGSKDSSSNDMKQSIHNKQTIKHCDIKLTLYFSTLNNMSSI